MQARQIIVWSNYRLVATAEVDVSGAVDGDRAIGAVYHKQAVIGKLNGTGLSTSEIRL
jgi:hypothetical protein